MQDLDAVLERQTTKLEELRSNAATNPSPPAVQALASIHGDRGATLVSMGRKEEAVEDQLAAAGYLSGLVLQAGRVDLLDRMVGAGEALRKTLNELGRGDEAADQELSEAQILLAAGQVEGSLANLRRMLNQRRAALETEPTAAHLEAFVKVSTVLGGALFQTERMEDAITVENEAVEQVQAFGDDQLPFLLSVRANRAVTLGSMGRTDEALTELGEVVEGWEKLLAADATEETLGGALRTLGARADLYTDLRRADEALADLDHALELAETHAAVEGAKDVLRQVLRQQAQLARAHGNIQKAFSAAERWVMLAQEESQNATSLEPVEELLEAGFERALLLHLAGNHEASLGDINQLIGGWQRLVEHQPERLDLHHRILTALDLRERSLTELGRHQEALADQSTIVDGFRELLRAGAPKELEQGLGVTLQRRATTLRALGRPIEAEADATEAQRLLGTPPSLLS